MTSDPAPEQPPEPVLDDLGLPVQVTGSAASALLLLYLGACCAYASAAVAATELVPALAEHATGLPTSVLAAGFAANLLASAAIGYGANKIKLRTLSRVPRLIIQLAVLLNFASLLVLAAVLFPHTNAV